MSNLDISKFIRSFVLNVYDSLVARMSSQCIMSNGIVDRKHNDKGFTEYRDKKVKVREKSEREKRKRGRNEKKGKEGFIRTATILNL